MAGSDLFGTRSGPAISNIVSTGVMMIPVIRESGFRPVFAGAVEAAASNGGQILPPVMRVVSPFVAGQIGLAYRCVDVAAILPPLLYQLETIVTVSSRGGYVDCDVGVVLAIWIAYDFSILVTECPDDAIRR